MKTSRNNWIRDHNEDSRYSYHASNYNRSINNPKFLNNFLLPSLKKELSRKISEAELRFIVSHIKNLDPARFQGKSVNEVSNALTEVFAEKLSKASCNDVKYVDTHELLKAQMGISTEGGGYGGSSLGTINVDVGANEVADAVNVAQIMGKSDPYDVQNMINPTALRHRTYIQFDSRHRSLDTDGTKELTWNHVNNVTRTQGSINTVGVIRDILGMRLSPFKIPYVANADNELTRLTMLIDEFSAQSVVAQEDRKYHFSLDTQVNGQWIMVSPEDQSDGYFWFNNPITQLDTLTISFGSPLQPVIFDLDRSTSHITYSNPAIITTTDPHNLQSGNSIIISDFTTTNPTRDSTLITQVNDQSGNLVTVIDDNQFSIPIDLTSLNNTIQGTIAVTNLSAAVVGTGTLFLTDLTTGDAVVIEDGDGIRRYFVVTVVDDTNLTLDIAYAGVTATGLYIEKQITGTLSVVNGSTDVVGVGTLFVSEVTLFDSISIVDSLRVIRSYTVTAINSDTSITIANTYGGITEAGLFVLKDNSISNLAFTTYFNSKRIFFMLELIHKKPAPY
jgi:hypothetical protein